MVATIPWRFPVPTLIAFALLALSISAAAQQPPRSPSAEAQRRAMEKLRFLLGRSVGDGRMLRPSGEWTEFHQTERVEYELDGLLLVIEGMGRAKTDNHPLLQAYG